MPQVRVDSHDGDFGTMAPQSRTPGALMQNAATCKDTDISLESVRPKLQAAQTCSCSRCMGSKIQGKDINATRGSLLVAKKRQPAMGASGGEEAGRKIRDKETDGHETNRSRSSPSQSDLKSLDDRSTSFKKRVEGITALLDMVTIPDLAFTRRRMIEILQHMLRAFCHVLLALKLLRRADARAEEYTDAVKKALIAGTYLLVLLKIVVTVVKVLGLIMDIMVVVSWPARVLKWCLLG